jgi:hypothetical protein
MPWQFDEAALAKLIRFGGGAARMFELGPATRIYLGAEGIDMRCIANHIPVPRMGPGPCCGLS